MYKEYFGLKEIPFSIAPDPRYLYMSEGHREALAHLEYGLRGDGGFVLLTGEVGTGKTTVCRCLLEQLPDDLDVAFVLNPRVTAGELLASVCDELGLAYPAGNTSIKVFVDRINEFLLATHARGRRAVLIIEEAQNLSFDVLEQLRLLTNLETNECKLLQIIMVGQPELRDILSRPELSQLSQRITARYHLGPLSREGVNAYVVHRLSVAGGPGRLFPSRTRRKIFQLTGGVPRLINLLCDRALLGAYVQGRDTVDRSTLVRAAKEVFGEGHGLGALRRRYAIVFAGVVLVVIGAALATAYYNLRPGRSEEAAAHDRRGNSNEQLAVRPRLDTLWWLDERSLPGQSLRGRGRDKQGPFHWALEDRFNKQTPAVDLPGQKQTDTLSETAPGEPGRGPGE